MQNLNYDTDELIYETERHTEQTVGARGGDGKGWIGVWK